MIFLGHIIVFLLAAAITWYFAGLLVESINSVALRFHQSGFTVAFFVLGFMTSISEISVMVNSTIDGVPQVSAGNLVGASFVIMLGIIPVLAIVGNGVQLKNTLQRKNLGLALLAVFIPVLLLLDGSVSRSEGLMCILAYGTLLYFIRRQQTGSTPRVMEAIEEKLTDRRRATLPDALKILAGGLFIFLAGHVLVQEVVYFSRALSVPGSIIGLLVLSVGTNIPELVIAARSVIKKHKDIAFGDYIGSTVTNTLIFGALPWLNGAFRIESSEFIVTAVLMAAGFVGFYVAAGSKNTISKKEGLILFSAYILFVMMQLASIIRFAAA